MELNQKYTDKRHWALKDYFNREKKSILRPKDSLNTWPSVEQ